MKTCGMCKLYKTECEFSKVEAPKGMDPSTFVACADFMPNDDKVTNSSKEYIEREAVVKMIKENSTTRFDWSEAVDIEDLIPAIKDIPAAEVAPVRHGEWRICCDGYYPYCSECGEEPKGGKMTNYCPNCGAYMDGGKSHE